jgi:hypothetical protein
MRSLKSVHDAKLVRLLSDSGAIRYHPARGRQLRFSDGIDPHPFELAIKE